MRSLEYNISDKELTNVSGGGRTFFHSLPHLGSELTELEKQPVDRSRFFTTNRELRMAVGNLDVLFVDQDQPADSRGVLKGTSSLLEPGNKLTKNDILSLLETDRELGSRLVSMVMNAQQRRQFIAQNEDWWDVFSDTEHFSHNVFQDDPTEQIVIGRDQIEPVTIYNFGEKLHRRHLEGVLGAVAAMSTLTDGYSRAIVPYIVVHEAFNAHFFERSGTTERAAGRAWPGEPFIEARRSALDIRAQGSKGQPWVSQLIAHEISHQIDEAVTPRLPDFSRYFHYVDANGDGLIDYIKPKDTFASGYHELEVRASRPINEYGFTNGTEDLATVGEETPFGGVVDKLRRDAYLEIIEAFKQNGAEKYGEMQPLPEKLKVEISCGGEIQLPIAPALASPIQIRVNSANTRSITDFFKKILG